MIDFIFVLCMIRPIKEVRLVSSTCISLTDAEREMSEVTSNIQRSVCSFKDKLSSVR